MIKINSEIKYPKFLKQEKKEEKEKRRYIILTQK
jgi:hypothetical protein